ncbi:hypothetical protein VOLCADRAFT_90941 [Volvox carteri f. nagariensis]|uniref:Pseudouridine synthase RsuA/RluA-like domain-containing protein n=1 Tax=Volvox carteri f. nagariensis TaxID=3068 RepID=D8TVS5_VOLCA|nr:uncharacterized protein VOLCADRAFT_90941 [Volvox carteri f. nagariensis]EFJ48245.1 hypothetical protein VOLCADRAFT_90941 [Volvox carteri f. nagariensis]|eukprot:XP_002950499.1 hypothetical protein VOLCADRAFT_90941 [Volvox carteri f. nagariensis]
MPRSQRAPPPLAVPPVAATPVMGAAVVAVSEAAVTAVAAVARRPQDDEIALRIAASRARRGTRLSYRCPACSISAATPANIARHMALCCRDLMLESLARGYPSPQHDAVVELLHAGGRQEQELRRRVLACVFWSGAVDPETGLPRRLEAAEAARRLGLPPARTSAVLQRAMAAVPLAADWGGEPLDVVHEDEHFLAVNKPPGMHTAPIHRFAAAAAATSSEEPWVGDDGSETTAAAPASGRTVPYQLEPYVLHRLDMNTSGLLLFAKRPEVVAGMHRQFRERTLRKLYLAAARAAAGTRPTASRTFRNAAAAVAATSAAAAAAAAAVHEAAPQSTVIAGPPKASSTTSRTPFSWMPPLTAIQCMRWLAGLQPRWQQQQQEQQHKQDGSYGTSIGAVAAATAGSIPSGASLMLCAPHTGRTHQIRVHLHHVGHPILGDDIYGVTGPWMGRQALHAAELRFTHPLTGQVMRLSAPLHDDMAAALAALGLPQPDVATLAEAAAEAEEWCRTASHGRGGGGGGGAEPLVRALFSSENKL